MYVTGFNIIRINKNTLFTGNNADGDGGDIYAQYSNFSFYVDSATIKNTQSINSIYLDQVNFFAKSLNIQRS